MSNANGQHRIKLIASNRFPLNSFGIQSYIAYLELYS